MHRCLQLPEIITAVVEMSLPDPLLYDDWFWSSDGIHNDIRAARSTGLALALTCTRFLHPCLARLWEGLDTPVHLLNVLSFPARRPSQTKTTGSSSDVAASTAMTEHTQDFPLDISPERWARFDFYASHVRYLVFSEENAAEGRWLAEVCTRHGRTLPLIPNLHHLSWHDRNHITDHRHILFQACCSHALRRLSIDVANFCYHNEHGDLVSSARSIFDSCPSLKELEVLGTNAHLHGSATLHKVSRVVLDAPQLEIFETLGALTPDALSHLAQMPKLRKLRLSNFDFTAKQQVAGHADTEPFPALQGLHWEGTNLKAVANLLQIFRGRRHLRSITVETMSHSPASDFEYFLDALLNHCHIGSLETLIVRTWSRSTPEFDSKQSWTLNEGTLQRLLTFKSIRNFTLRYYGSTWDDAALEALAFAWPYLSDLRLAHGDSFFPSQNFTVNALYSLAKFCPRIEKVSLPLKPWSSEDIVRRRDWEHRMPSTKVRLYLAIDHKAEEQDVLMDIFRDFFPNFSFIPPWNGSRIQ